MSVLTTCVRSFAVAVLLGLSSLPVLAQTKPRTATPAPTLKDGAFRRNGKLYRLQAGKVSPLTASLRFPNGTTLLPNGTLVSKSGARRQIGEGKAINMQGDVVIYRDDMMTAQAIEQHDEATTGAKPTVIEIPVATNLAALSTELQRTSQRLEQLQQLTDLLSERAAATAAGTAAPTTMEQQIQSLSQQLRP